MKKKRGRTHGREENKAGRHSETKTVRKMNGKEERNEEGIKCMQDIRKRRVGRKQVKKSGWKGEKKRRN